MLIHRNTFQFKSRDKSRLIHAKGESALKMKIKVTMQRMKMKKQNECFETELMEEMLEV